MGASMYPMMHSVFGIFQALEAVSQVLKGELGEEQIIGLYVSSWT